MTVRISRHGARRWRRGHPWIYQSDVEHAEVAAGDLVDVAAPDGRVLGVAAWSSESNIALRATHIPTGAEDREAGWLALLAAAVRRRQGRPEACRLVNSDADGLPGLVVDRYGPGISIQATTQAADRRVPAVVDWLRARFEPRTVALRNDGRVREFEGLKREKSLLHGDQPQVLARVGRVVMAYDLMEGQKTGGFLDQSDNRLAAAEFARGEALDCFAYDGGFSLHLAMAGVQVTAVDSSIAALAGLEANARRNRLRIPSLCANVFDMLREHERIGRRFDTIILDPPAFVRSRKAVDAGRRAYKETNLRAMKLLNPGGRLVTCSCSAHLARADFEAVVAEAAADAHRWARVVERRGAAPDHPSLITASETDYLKVLFIEVG
jgi:23S rRNA (cytosine1962-C5)-methyltransferase